MFGHIFMHPFDKRLSGPLCYEKLDTDECDRVKDTGIIIFNRRRWIACFLLPLSSTIFLLLGFIVFYIAGSGHCCAPSDWSTPGYDQLPRRDIKFVGSFESVTPYRGPPSAELDAAWSRFTHSRWADGTAVVLGVGLEEIEHAKKHKDEEWYNSTVQLSDENGGGKMATLEMFHQLHCLDMIRKFTHFKYPYYKTKGGVFDRPVDVQMNHIDHCIEIIRQVIMCNGDTGLITFHWTENNPVAYPDFNTWHSCRNPEDVLALAQRHHAPMKHQVKKTDGVITMPFPP